MKQFRRWAVDSSSSHTDLYYVGAKAHGPVYMQAKLKEVSPLLNICSIDGRIFLNALSEQEDFEDRLIWRAAKDS